MGMSAPPIGTTSSTPSQEQRRDGGGDRRDSVGHGVDRRRHDEREDDRVGRRLAGKADRSLKEPLLELPERHHAAREADRADHDPEEDHQQDHEALLGPEVLEPVELGDRDQRDRAAADPVERGYELGHRGHRHPPCAGDADRRADRHGDGDLDQVERSRVEQRYDDRDQHPDGRDHVALAGRGGLAEPPDAQDEEQRRDQVGEGDEGVHGLASRAARRCPSAT
jgi:hypothetical protein